MGTGHRLEAVGHQWLLPVNLMEKLHFQNNVVNNINM